MSRQFLRRMAQPFENTPGLSLITLQEVSLLG
jgi:hypothetical protein